MNIGNIFKDKLQSLSQKPSDDLWDKIASSSEFAAFNRKKRRFRIIRNSIVAFSLVAVSVLTILLLQNDGKNEDSSVLVNNSDNKSQNTAKTENNTLNSEEIINPAQIIVSDSKKTSENTIIKNESSNSHTPLVTFDANNNPYQKQADIVSITPDVSRETSDITNQSQNNKDLNRVFSEPSDNKNTKNIETNDLPSTPLIYSHDTSVCRNSKLILYILNAEKVTWNIGSREPVVEIYPEETTTYYANVKKTDGQDTTIYIKVEVIQCGLYIPNAFTPNGDGINDEFKIQIPEELQIVNFEISIFEPSGRLIFHSKNPSQGWDGNYQGGKSPQGAYFYVVTYKDKMNEKRVNKGQLILYR